MGNNKQCRNIALSVFLVLAIRVEKEETGNAVKSLPEDSEDRNTPILGDAMIDL
jgi:hypothetical protein